MIYTTCTINFDIACRSKMAKKCFWDASIALLTVTYLYMFLVSAACGCDFMPGNWYPGSKPQTSIFPYDVNITEKASNQDYMVKGNKFTNTLL